MVDASIVVTENAYNRLLQYQKKNNNTIANIQQRTTIILEATKEVA